MGRVRALRARRFAWAALVWWMSAAAMWAGNDPPPVSFRQQIAPLLHRRCAACHNEESAKGHYRLDSFARLLKPGVSDEEPVVAGEPEHSPLFHLLLEQDPEERMPQKADPLPEAEIILIKRWISEGAKFDGGAPERPLVEMAREGFLRPAPSHYARPSGVTALAFSPDGTQLAVAGYYELLIWSLAESRIVQRVGGLPERITSLSWHTKRNLLAVAGGTPGQWGTVALVDPAAGYQVRILCDLAESALSVAFNPDGTQIAVGAGDRTLRLFDTGSGKQTRLFRMHADWVQSVAYNPSGTRIVSASRDRTVRILDVAKGDLEITYSGHETGVLQAAFHPSGTTVFSLAAHTRDIHRWEVIAPESKPKLFTFGAEVQQFALGKSNLFATTAAESALQVRQLTDGAPLFTLYGHRDAVQAIALHPVESQLLASGSVDGEVMIWDLACGTWTQRFTPSP